MPWKKSDSILRKTLTSRGMSGMVNGGLICEEADKLYPGLFRAVSVRNGILHIEVTEAQMLGFKLIQGKLLKEINAYADRHHLPAIARIRLTIAAT